MQVETFIVVRAKQTIWAEQLPNSGSSSSLPAIKSFAKSVGAKLDRNQGAFSLPSNSISPPAGQTGRETHGN